MDQFSNLLEISDEERRRRLGRVYAILIEAAERRRAQQDAAATPSGDGKRYTDDQTTASPGQS